MKMLRKRFVWAIFGLVAATILYLVQRYSWGMTELPGIPYALGANPKVHHWDIGMAINAIYGIPLAGLWAAVMGPAYQWFWRANKSASNHSQKPKRNRKKIVNRMDCLKAGIAYGVPIWFVAWGIFVPVFATTDGLLVGLVFGTLAALVLFLTGTLALIAFFMARYVMKKTRGRAKVT
jgi:hypothetical protein